MEKFLKRVRILAILLIAILISVIAFCGLYVQKNGVWENLLPEFNFGMELKGFRELRYVLDNSEEEKEVYVDSEGNYKGNVLSDTTHAEETGEVAQETEVEGEYKKEKRVIKANEPENINIENFEKTKKIIQKRLETIDLYEYNIRQDSVTGELIIELPDNDNLELEQSLISTIGKVELIDHQTGLILIEDSNVKKATALATNPNNQYQVYLQIEFDEIGKEKLKEISNKYITVTSGDGTETTNYITINLDGQALTTTYFGEELDTGIIQIPMGEATTDYETYFETVTRVSKVAELIEGEALPLSYKLSSDNFIKSTISENCKLITLVVCSILVIAISVYMIIKFKYEGLRQAILSIGYIGVLILIIRYTNVVVTLNSLVVLAGVVAINYVFGIKFLNNLKSNSNRKVSLKTAMKELYLSIIPVCIIAVIFTFMSGVVISSIGMTLFWGLLVQALLSLIVLI